MLAKIFLLSLLATVIVANPVVGPAEDDDLPVYTEKVMQAKPTKPGNSTPRIPRFNSKKLASLPQKEAPQINPPEPYAKPKPTTSVPKVVLVKTSEPIRSNTRPVRRTSHPLNAIDARPVMRGVHNAPRPSYAPAPELGVEYAAEVPVVNHRDPVVNHQAPFDNNQAPVVNYPAPVISHPAPVINHQAPVVNQVPAALVDDYRPRRLRNKQVVEYGSAAGNAPEFSYAAAPQALSSSDGSYTAEYKDEHPQPYIFGYEFQDEKGATQNRQEQGDERGAKRGSYGYRDEHGIYRQVEYVADANGFRAVIKTNEPGTDNQNPADVQMHSEAGQH